jgi:exopolyphosphatase/guanosine-5'-triphosphate,3'-diphosphate pyrophosphatase
VLAGAPAAQVAARYHLEEQRVRLLPAGLLALGAAAAALGRPLEIGNGGLREGVLLDLAGTG